MATIGVDPATGMLTLDGQVLDRYDPRLWGEMGQPVSGFGPGTQQGFRTRQSFDPRYFQENYDGQDEAGDQYSYSLRPEVSEMFGGRSQLLQAGHGGVGGGPGEFIDPSKLTYDPRYGVLTDAGNINATEDSGFSRWMNDGALMYMLGGGALAAIGAVGGLAGALPGAAGAGELGGGALTGLSEAESLAALEGFGGVGSMTPVSVDVLPGLAEFGAGTGAVPEGFNAADWWTGDPSGATGPLGGSPPVDVSIIPEGFVGPEYSPEAEWWTGDPTGNTGPLGPGGTPVDVPVIPGNASESWWERLLNNATDKLPDLARDLLGGGQQGGGNSIISALMGGAGKLGEHRQDNDPYGLQASGYGPWKGLTDDPKAKVVDAMMKRKQDSIWS